MQNREKKALYDRLGGVYTIATVVDDFIDRIMVDPRLNANPRVDEAHHRVSPAGFKYLVTEMVCWATGGPQQYSGRSMEDTSHATKEPYKWQLIMLETVLCNCVYQCMRMGAGITYLSCLMI